jgi:uncharacterized delta-60 repeat protein
LQPDGKILFAGQLGQVSSSIGRLNPDGTTDGSFAAGGPGSLYNPNAILVQPDGKILIAAQFTKPNGQTDFLGRLNSDGTLDAAFAPGVIWSVTIGHAVQSLALQTDGRIIIGGQFTAVGGYPRQYLARLFSDGSVDTTFAPVPDREVYCVGLQQDGRILVGGNFLTLGGQTRNYVGRLNNTTTASQLLSFDGTVLSWQRFGAGPEFWRATAEFSTNGGVNWTMLGSGTRITSGWRWTGIWLPTNAVIRTRGFVAAGQSEASSWYLESALTLNSKSAPRIISDNQQFGFSSNRFGFDVGALQGQIVVVEGSTNLQDWIALATNPVGSTPPHFSDANTGSFSVRFYRVRLW